MINVDLLADDEFMNSLVAVFVLSGFLILNFDVRTYVMADMKKERKTARLLGWTNLILAVLTFVTYQIYSYWWLHS